MYLLYVASSFSLSIQQQHEQKLKKKNTNKDKILPNKEEKKGKILMCKHLIITPLSKTK